jgi:hypothetical protein
LPHKKAGDMKNYSKEDKPVGRIVAFLTREEIDFIDSLAKDALFSTGHKLSRTDIIRAIIDTLKAVNIDGNGVYNKLDLEKKLLYLMHITSPGSLSGIKEKKHADENS